MKQTWDFSKYQNQTNKTLAARYGYSKNTFKKNIEGIKPQLDELRKALRPTAKEVQTSVLYPCCNCCSTTWALNHPCLCPRS